MCIRDSGGVLAQRGLGVEEFPCDVPVYTGHYHNPHSLWGREGARRHPIMYVGSQWQTSMSEAHEDKRMLLLDASKGWQVHEEIPVHVGRRHFRASSMAHLATKLPVCLSNVRNECDLGDCCHTDFTQLVLLRRSGRSARVTACKCAWKARQVHDKRRTR